MNSKVLTTPLKILSCGAFLLALGACSGHKFGDPAEKYGNLNQIAKDTEVKDVERPLAVGTNPVRIDAAQEFAQSHTSSFEVKVTLPYQGFTYNLHLNAGGVGTFHPKLTHQSGLTDTWSVDWSIPEVLLKDESYRAVKLEALVDYTGFPNDTIRARYARIQPREWTQVILVRRSAIPEFVEFRIDREQEIAELGSVTEFEVIMDPKGLDRQQLVLSAQARLVECKSTAEVCSLVNKVEVGAWDGANGNLRALGSFDLRAPGLETLLADSDKEMQLRLDLTVAYAEGESVTKSKFLAVAAQHQLASPSILWTGTGVKAEQGSDYEIKFHVQTPGAVAKVVLLDAKPEGVSAQLNCTSTASGAQCAITGSISCSAQVGTASLPVLASSERGSEAKATEGKAQLQILSSPACQEEEES